MKRLGSAVAVGVAALVLTGCPGDHDVDVHGRVGGPATVIDMPNHFSSIASKCDGLGHRVFVADHGNSKNGGSAPFVIDDPRCPGGVPEAGR